MSVIGLAASQLAQAHLVRPGLHSFGNGAGRPPRGPRIRLEYPGGPCRGKSFSIVIADDSGSVVGPVGADPVSNRYEECKIAFRRIAAAGAGRDELGAVVHFDTPTSGDVLPVRLSQRGLQLIERGLRMPFDARGSSVLRPSLCAVRLLAAALPNHLATLVVLSDFELFDSDPAETLRQMAGFPGDVHAVVLGGGGPTDADFGDNTLVTRITSDDEPGAVARAVLASLAKHRRR